MAEKPEKQTNPLAENGELQEGELEQVAGGVSVDSGSPLQVTAESAQDSAQSNVLKTKHDTVKNSISNVR